MTATYTAEADHLSRSYRRAVGYALQYGIPTFLPGTGRPGDLGPWSKPLGTLTDEIRDHERVHGITDGLCPPPRSPDGMEQAVCTRGHPITLWGNSPLMGPRGQRATYMNAPLRCRCGAAAYFGRRP